MKANHTYIRFDDPDLTPKELDPNWDKETLLLQRGVFPLVSVAVILGKEILIFRKAAKRLNELGASAWEWIGVGKLRGEWLVRMDRFSLAIRTLEKMGSDCPHKKEVFSCSLRESYFELSVMMLPKKAPK